MIDSGLALFDDARAQALRMEVGLRPDGWERLHAAVTAPGFADPDMATFYDMNHGNPLAEPPTWPAVEAAAEAEARARLAWDPYDLDAIDVLLGGLDAAPYEESLPDRGAAIALARTRVEAAPYDPKSWQALDDAVNAVSPNRPIDPLGALAGGNAVAWGGHAPDTLWSYLIGRHILFANSGNRGVAPEAAQAGIDASLCPIVRADRLLREVCAAVPDDWTCRSTDFTAPEWQDALDHAEAEALCAAERDGPLESIVFQPVPLPPPPAPVP